MNGYENLPAALEQRLSSDIILRVEQIAAQAGISHEALRLSESLDVLTNQMIYELVRHVATVPGVEQVRAPLTWWDALKEAEVRRSPIMRWWVRNHPVEYRTWRALEVLPHFPELDKYRGEIRLARFVEDYRD